MGKPDTVKWRVGRSLGRTLYRQIGDEPSKDDEFLGIMDTRELAEGVVIMMNDILESRDAEGSNG